MQEAGGDPRGSLVRALGGLWKAPGWRREDLEVGPGAMGGPPEALGGATSDLSLCFPVFGGQQARNIGKHKSGGALGRSRVTPVQPNRPRASKGTTLVGGFSLRLGPGRGTFKEGI